MNVSINELMTKNLLIAYLSDTIAQVRHRMLQNNVRVLPVVNREWEAVGIVTAGDLLLSPHIETPISQVMSNTVHTVDHQSGAHVAARIMRRFSAQHVVVTHANKVVGLLSVYDLLRLVENFQFEQKHPQPPGIRSNGVVSSPSKSRA